MLKWSMRVQVNGLYKIKYGKKELVIGLHQADAERIVAAHNAIIDMAFDSPGNVR